MLPPRSSTRKWPRVFVAVLTLVTSVVGVDVFAESLLADGFDPFDAAMLFLYVVLFSWISFSFWVAALGFLVTILDPIMPTSSVEPTQKREPGPLPRTVLLAPVYNEDTSEVFAGLQATCESLRAAGVAGDFDLFILSDTRDAAIGIEEERAWSRLASAMAGVMGVHYRRRTNNEGKKSGNVAEFCRRWGRAYKYMIIFDADSVMAGATVAELIRRMEEMPDVGIMQAPPLPVGRESLFARMQQFCASAYGDIYAAGLACWSQSDANYYGHNAVIRVEPFIEHCSLPRLPGKPPFGGDILSHDFIEAALMRRAGWRVLLANELTGSYEQCPPTLIDFAKRDQRWCQGNLQHLRILMRSGLHPVSRIHLFSGIMGYCASAIWLVFIIVGIVQEVFRGFGWPPVHEVSPLFTRLPVVVLLLVTLAMLLLPKFMAWLVLERDRHRLIGHGDYSEAAASAIIETILSVFVAPVMMIYHSMFVVAAFTGHKVQWSGQNRSESGTTFGDAARELGFHTSIGFFGLAFVWFFAPALFWWTFPVGIGLVLSIPLAVMLSSVELGKSFREHRLFLTPEEQFESPILRRRRMVLESFQASRERNSDSDPIGHAVLVPAVHCLHLATLNASRNPADPPVAAPSIPQTAAELEKLTSQQKLALLSDESAMRQLHRLAWTTWPVEDIVSHSR
jgi:membrane glycosyltransferase